MEKFSVKKPFTILVMVAMIIALGVVSVTRMPMDLLPSSNFPYMVVVTPYPGASPERVESEVTEPIESSLSTINGVKNVFSTSAENYSVVELEFQDSTDMDSALVRVSSALDDLEGSLPEGTTNSTLLEVSMDMVATMYVSVTYTGGDIYQVTDYAEDTIIPYLERQEGVATVSSIGLVDKYVQVDLDQDKIDALNDKILAEANEQLADAKAQLDEAQAQVDAAQETLESQQSSFGSTVSSELFSKIDGTVIETANELKSNIDEVIASLQVLQSALNGAYPSDGTETNENITQIQAQITQIITDLTSIRDAIQDSDLPALMSSVTDISRCVGQINSLIDSIAQETGDQFQSEITDLQTSLQKLSDTMASVPQILDELQSGYATLTQAQLDAAVGFSEAAAALKDAQDELADAQEQYETARENALENANADTLLTADNLSQLIYAQNFSMPAGYIDDENDHSWLLRVGDEYESAEDIEDALLADIEGIGTIRISDVATVTILDNADESYAKLNGNEGIVLCIYKNSSAGTNEVANTCLQAFEDLEAQDSNYHFVTLMNQGEYIDLIVESLVQSMLLGAILAVVVLALFLRSVLPTLVVALSIPLSVLLTVVLMYFTGLSLNMMTLAGLALGIGMLVDNSIVVMENIFRLRQKGIAAPRAAVQGGRQVRSPIIASTITTICVFLPMVFTSGTVRRMLIPMALTISYCLAASLLMALTVVPAASSTIMKKVVPKPTPIFAKVQRWYGKALRWCLGHRALTLAVVFGLFGWSVYDVFHTGITMFPDMTTPQVEVEILTDEEMTREESYATMDQAMDAILSVDGVQDVGIMDETSTTGFISQAAFNTSQYGAYICYVNIDDHADSDEIQRICDSIETATADLDCDVTASTGDMAELVSYLSGSDLTIHIYGTDLDELEAISEQVMEAVGEVDGFTEIENGMEEGTDTLHLIIDKDKAVACGLTVAQIYQQIAAELETSVTSTTVTIDGETMDVQVTDTTDQLTKENLLDMEFETTSTASEMESMITGSEDTETETHKLSEFATVEETVSLSAINRENEVRYMTVTATSEEGYNTTLQARELQPKLDAISADLDNNYSIELSGETTQISNMLTQMVKMLALALLFIYLVMVAQFQSLLSPFIVMFTVPLGLTGGVIALRIAGEDITMLAMMGFLILLGTVVNNGIVFVDYVNRLRLGGMERRDALVATGQTRMRPILMTALTTIFSLGLLIFGSSLGSQMGRGMALVIAGGLLYSTFMTLFIIPIMYDIFFRRSPLEVDVGSDLEDENDDAADFLLQMKQEQESSRAQEEPAAAPEEKENPDGGAPPNGPSEEKSDTKQEEDRL